MKPHAPSILTSTPRTGSGTRCEGVFWNALEVVE
jgi:hypothetical protein